MAETNLRLEDIVAVVHGPGEPIYKLHVISTLLDEADLRPKKEAKEPRPQVGAAAAARAERIAEEKAREEREKEQASTKRKSKPARSKPEPKDAK